MYRPHSGSDSVDVPPSQSLAAKSTRWILMRGMSLPAQRLPPRFQHRRRYPSVTALVVGKGSDGKTEPAGHRLASDALPVARPAQFHSLVVGQADAGVVGLGHLAADRRVWYEIAVVGCYPLITRAPGF